MAYKIIAYIELFVTLIVGISIFSKSPSETTWQEVQELIKDERVDVIARGSKWEKDENTIYVYLNYQRRGYSDIDNRVPKYYFSIDSDSEFDEINDYAQSQKNYIHIDYNYSYETSFERFSMAMFWVIFGFVFIYLVVLGVKIENGDPFPKPIAILSGGVLIAVVLVVLIGVISLIVCLASFGVAGFFVGFFLFILACLYSVVIFGK